MNLSLIVTTLELMNVVLPFTVKLPSISASLLMFRLAPFMLPITLMLPEVVFPLTLKLVSVPTEVILACAFCVTY